MVEVRACVARSADLEAHSLRPVAAATFGFEVLVAATLLVGLVLQR